MVHGTIGTIGSIGTGWPHQPSVRACDAAPKRPLTLSELAEHYPINRPAVSHHLTVLMSSARDTRPGRAGEKLSGRSIYTPETSTFKVDRYRTAESCPVKQSRGPRPPSGFTLVLLR